MPQTLGSDMARTSFHALLEKVERTQPFSADEARNLIADCELGNLIAERLWQLFQGFLDAGMESRKLSFLLKELMDILELGLKTFRAATERVRVTDLPDSEKTDALLLLMRFSRQTAERQDELASLLNWIEAPPKDVDPASLRRERSEEKAEGYIGLSELTSHLLSSDGD